MYDISAIVKDSPYVFRVYGTGEMGVTVVGVVLLAVPLPRVLRNLQKVPRQLFQVAVALWLNPAHLAR